MTILLYFRDGRWIWCSLNRMKLPSGTVLMACIHVYMYIRLSTPLDLPLPFPLLSSPSLSSPLLPSPPLPSPPLPSPPLPSPPLPFSPLPSLPSPPLPSLPSPPLPPQYCCVYVHISCRHRVVRGGGDGQGPRPGSSLLLRRLPPPVSLLSRRSQARARPHSESHVGGCSLVGSCWVLPAK